MSKSAEQPMVVDSDDTWPGLDDINYEPHFQQDAEYTFGTDPAFASPFVDPTESATFDPLTKSSLRGDSAVSFAHGRPFKASSPDTASPESSGQESSEESTRGRKRKTSGDSGDGRFDSVENSPSRIGGVEKTSANVSAAVFFGAPHPNVAGPFDGLIADPDVEGMNREMENHFDFDSAASSPGNLGQQVATNAYGDVSNAMPQASMGIEVRPAFPVNSPCMPCGHNSNIWTGPVGR
jgi:hypothetical protein